MAKRIKSNTVKRTQIELDKLAPGSVVLDELGHAWQADRVYWYRAYGDSSQVSSFELAQRCGTFDVIYEPAR